jgi:hypothetical protein
MGSATRLVFDQVQRRGMSLSHQFSASHCVTSCMFSSATDTSVQARFTFEGWQICHLDDAKP